MKTITLYFKKITCWIPLILLMSSSGMLQAGTSGEEFQLLKKTNNINLFYRWIPSTGGHSTREFKATFDVKVSAEKIISMLKDEKNIHTWIKPVKLCRRLEHFSESQWESYLLFSAPWPIGNQDCVLHYSVRESETGIIVITFKSNPNVQSVEGVKRISGIKGQWIIHKQSPGNCKLECYFSSTEKSSAPRWITDPIIQNFLLHTLDAFRLEAKK